VTEVIGRFALLRAEFSLIFQHPGDFLSQQRILFSLCIRSEKLILQAIDGAADR
jgi:hypothetical protein